MGRVLVAAAGVGFFAALLTSLVSGVPVPQIHDELSYLLAADTYAHGRLTNPPHPLWPWFETFHVLQQPTYMSKYPPGQGLLLALGQLIGLPIAGAWIGAALACAAVAWMLGAWMPARWALAGAALLAFHPAMLGWSHSYWGAAVSILGGALTIGAARRLIDAASLRHSILLGLGIVILANTRLWEGFLLVVALFAVAITMRFMRWRALVPAAVVVALGGLFIVYDNVRVTHDPLLMPYALYERQYIYTPTLVWQQPHPVTLRQKVMRQITFDFDLPFYRERHSLGGFLLSIPKTMAAYGNAAFQFIPDPMIVRVMSPAGTIALTVLAFVLAVPLFVPLFFAVRAIRRDRTLMALLFVALLSAPLALFTVIFPLPHYGGPFVPLFILFWLLGVRECGRAHTVIATVVAYWLLGIAIFFVENRPWRYRWYEVGQRLAVERGFASKPGRHLVLVRYLDSHNPHFEWVHNAAGIDAQRVVWAHDLGDNAPILGYYGDRSAWLLTVGDRAPVLESYGRSPAQARRPLAKPAPAGSD
jgi:hypothetical protein